jgi:1,4-dihydroxy-2-naphthoate octaprenyltransferase
MAQAVEGKIHVPALVAAAIAALLIQVATNLFNDIGDFERGADGPDRLGPTRAAAGGLLAPEAIKRAAYACFAVAALLGVYLVARGGALIVLIGLTSLIAGWSYSGGPRPISHSPLGELFVIVFFGLAAVCGVYWLCALKLSPAAALAGLALGLFAAAVLMINNIRDAAADARNGRKTLAI